MEGRGPPNQAGRNEGEPEGVDWCEDRRSESDTAKDTSLAVSPTPVADDGEEGSSDPFNHFKDPPYRPDAWTPFDRIVDRDAIREVRRARDSPRRAGSSTWSISGARDHRILSRATGGKGRQRP
eukprot:6905722-Pyramimonas_sp.AAC.1